MYKIKLVNNNNYRIYIACDIVTGKLGKVYIDPLDSLPNLFLYNVNNLKVDVNNSFMSLTNILNYIKQKVMKI